MKIKLDDEMNKIIFVVTLVIMNANTLFHCLCFKKLTIRMDTLAIWCLVKTGNDCMPLTKLAFEC